MYYTPGHLCPGCVVHHYSQFDGNYTLENLYEQFVENYTLDQIDGNYTLEKLGMDNFMEKFFGTKRLHERI